MIVNGRTAVLRTLALVVTLLSATFVFGADQGAPEPTYQFVNGFWLDGGRFVKRVTYANQRKLQFTRPARVDTVVDLAGAYVIPPLCEAHNHNLGSDHENEATITRYLRDGVFYVKIMSNLPRETGLVRHTYNHPGSVDAAFANGGVTGSGGHPIRLREQLLERGAYEGFTRETLRDHAYFVVDTPADLDAKWPLVLQFRPDFIKAFLLHSEEYAKRRDDEKYFGARGLDPQIFPLLVERAHAARLRVSVHINSAEDFHAAVEAGADEIAHLPGRQTVERIDRADANLAAQKGITVVTTAVLIERQLERDRQLHAELRQAQIDNLRLLRAAGVTLAIGSDEYDDTSTGEASHLRKLEVFDDRELLEMWTLNCARTVFPERKVGRLAPGYEASFLTLDGNPLVDWSSLGRIRYRFKDGMPLVIADQPATSAAGRH
jgi:imidazolonepropionase-like amidohydrolase